MPSRQSHSKSRGGCNECKSRRIKCDEQGPPCFSCIARNAKCEYSEKARLLRKRPTQVSLPTSSGTSCDSTRTVEGPESSSTRDHLFELELMNHWSAHTYATFCHQSGQENEHAEQELLQTIMPREALSNSYLLKATFALASLHTATLTCDTAKERYFTAAFAYHNASLALFMENLSHVTESNCQAMYACSLAHFVLGIALAENAPAIAEAKSNKEVILSVLALFAGSKKILSLFERQLSQMPVAIVLSEKMAMPYSKFDLSFTRALSNVHSLNRQRYGESDFHRYEINRSALDELEASSVRHINGTESALIGWLISLEEEFVTALQESEIISTLGLMHWATLLDRPSSLWWVFKSGASLVTELAASLLNLTPMEQAACCWCQDQISELRRASRR